MGLDRSVTGNKTRFYLENMPDRRYRQAQMNALAVLQALGDETRYQLYRELAGSPRPLGAPQLAERLGLHANTVRMHLERMREAGLVEVEPVHRGTVGRPQHVYALASGAPGLDFDPPAHAVLAGLLAAMAERLGGDRSDAEETGRAWGKEAARRTRSGSCVSVLVNQLTQLGFDPAVERDGASTKVSFLQCPFRDLAEAYPELVCNLHRGICSGALEQAGGGSMEHFSTLYDPDPCHVRVAAG
jgi:predicted ArsR family transcriptional regulator